MTIDFDEFLEYGRRLHEKGVADEDLLSAFRQRGATMMESARLIRNVNSITLAEAHNLVHRSVTWADYRESQEHLQETFLDVLSQLSRDDREKG